MVMFPLVSNAQLNVVEQVEEAEVLASSRMGAIKLKLDKGIYYLRIDTNYKYDSPMLFRLGTSAESAVATLNDLVTVATTLKKKTHLKVDGGKVIYDITREAMNTLWLTADGYIGVGAVTKAELDKFIETIVERQWN